MANNTRRQISEPYDPKQRIVGGIVLFILMIFIYLILKLLLGLSSYSMANNGESYQLSQRQDDEMLVKNEDNDGSPSANVQPQPITTAQLKQARLPEKFVFLNIFGRPYNEEEQESVDDTPPRFDSGWAVRAASLRAESRANALVADLKVKGFDAKVVKIGRWYTVRTYPHPDRRVAENQLRELRTMMGIKGLIIRVR